MIKRILLPLLLIGSLLVSGCGTSGLGTSSKVDTDAGTTAAQETTAAIPVSENTSDMFTDRDLEIGYDTDTSAVIHLTDNGAACDADTVEISGSTVKIQGAGTYILSGTLDDGMIIVDIGDKDKVQLVLDGAQITSSTSAAVYVLSADKVFITTAPDSDNTLSNGGEYKAIDDNNIDAVIFSKSDLTLNGSGTLRIDGAAGHGVVSKDDLVLTSGILQVTATGHGLCGKDSVRIAGGDYTIVSGKDGIHAENDADAGLGFLYIAAGVFHITAQGDGMSAGAYLKIEDGTYTVYAGGGAANAAVKNNDVGFRPGGTVVETGTDDSISTKGIKAGTDLIITGGSFAVDAADDALHSNGNIDISGGTLKLSTGDDGVHADSTVTISGGSIHITESYEGIEGLCVNICGGDISLVASDDGLNAAGGKDSSGFGGRGGDAFAATEGACIQISGGILRIDASGDGIDSNGDLFVSGGEVYVSGPTDSGDGALDYDGEAAISGGILVAAGAAGMAQNFGTSSTQGAIMVTVQSGSAGSMISLYDSDGKELLSWQPEKEYASVVVSCPAITQGATYTLTAGGDTVEITMDSMIYGTDGGMRGNMGERPGGMGGGPGVPWGGQP